MSLPEDLLSPIEGETPSGPDLRGSNEFAEIERAFLEAEQPSTMSPGGIEAEEVEGFGDVVELSTEFLQTQSKDLKVAAFLAASLLRVDGFKGLAEGLEVILGLLKEYWDGMYPGIPSRGPVLDWFGSDDLSYALFLQPLTEFGHAHREYKEWVSRGEEISEDEPDQDPEEDFESGFGQTSWEWYSELVSSLKKCKETLTALDELGKEKFKEAGEKPPRYASMSDGLKRMTAAAEDLLGRKPPPPGSVSPEPDSTDGPAVPEDRGTGEESTGPVGATPVSATPNTKEEAAALVGVAAGVMRKENPGDPSPYLLIRGLRWGELRAGGKHIDPRWLDPPTTSQRTHLKSLFLDQKYEELLEAAEGLMATPVGRGWLDLQRYAVLASDRLGPGYQLVGSVIRSAIRSLLADLPDLLDATLMDDSPSASRDTSAWLSEEGLLPTPEAKSQEQEAQARRADRVIREAGYDRAAAMAQGGDPQGAIELLMERAEHERSHRARFVTKAEAAGIMVDHGMEVVARPILDELLRLIEAHNLEGWEAAEVIAKPMSLFIRCLGPGEESRKGEVYPRLAKLDPVLAMEVSRRMPGPAPTPAPSTQAPEQASNQDSAPESTSAPGGVDPSNKSMWDD